MPQVLVLQGRALYGPIPVKTETFRELWAPLVHTNFGGNSYGPIIGPYLFLGKFVWTNGPESSSKVSPYTGIGPWMALPSFKGSRTSCREIIFGIFCQILARKDHITWWMLPADVNLPFLSRYFCKSVSSSLLKVVYTPPIRITMHFPLVSRCFCRSIRVRGCCWKNTPQLRAPHSGR